MDVRAAMIGGGRTTCTGVALLVALAACQGPHGPGGPPGSLGVASMRAPYHARTSNRFVLKLFSGSDSGLVLGGGPMDGNPGLQLTDLSFVENPAQAKTFLWAFTPDAKLLDSQCRPLTRAEAIAIANTAGANSAIVVDYLGDDGRPVAPAKVQIWIRSTGGVADCQAEETTP